jgi:hypothetical protein
MPPPKPPTPRRALVLLAMMTLATFGGPVAIGVVLRGGKSPDWPPDRAVEWMTLVGITALVIGMMVMCVAIALSNQRAMARMRAKSERKPAD